MQVFECLPIVWIIISQIRFEAPIILVGLTALSVEICTKRLVLKRSAALATFKVPNTLFLIASLGEVSISGTCLCAAALNTISGRYFLKMSSTLPLSLILAIKTTKFKLGNFLLNSCSMS